jgi:ATP-binding cassette, subfamily F, member 3
VAERTIAIEARHLNSYDGGWAEYVRQREARQAPPPPSVERKPPAKPRKPPTKPKVPSELERVEAEIAAHESTVAELERRLAEDWNDVEMLAAHRRARDELQALLQKWERLFERVHT